MPRIQALDPATATNRTKELLEEVQVMFGATPNLFRTAGIDFPVVRTGEALAA